MDGARPGLVGKILRQAGITVVVNGLKAILAVARRYAFVKAMKSK